MGSARDEAELGLLMEEAQRLLEDDRQGVLDLGITPQARRVAMVPAPGQPVLFGGEPAPGRPAGGAAGADAEDDARALLYDVLAGVYADLGFDALGDEVFRDLVIARVVEPTSLLDVDRVLAEMGRVSASLSTRKRTLRRCFDGNYRDRLAELCFSHVVTCGDVSLVLYDVTVRHEALVVRVEVKDHHRGLAVAAGREAGGSLTGETTGRAGAAPTKPCRVRTVGWCGCGERGGEVYARNRCHHLS